MSRNIKGSINIFILSNKKQKYKCAIVITSYYSFFFRLKLENDAYIYGTY